MFLRPLQEHCLLEAGLTADPGADPVCPPGLVFCALAHCRCPGRVRGSRSPLTCWALGFPQPQTE